MAKLYTLLKSDENQVRKILTKELKANGYSPLMHEQFIYAEGSIPVLLVAHYDTIPDAPKYIKNVDGVLSAKKGLGADDRAGIYAILELIKKHHCYVLFTGGEERGCIGARAFTKSGIKPEVNYIIELDRRGNNDAVYYDGENEEFEKFISSFGWETAIGSCTDICEVAPYLDVMGVNLSIGYQHEHTPLEILDTKVMNETIARVSKMFDGERFEWHEKEYTYSSLLDWCGYSPCRTETTDDEIWYIEFINELGRPDVDYAWGWTEKEAIGDFLIEHQDLTYGSIVSVINALEVDIEEEKNV